MATSDMTGSSAEDVELNHLETPMLSVAKAGSIIQLLPTALRLWDKLGLAPRGGVKDATVYALFQEEDEGKVQQVGSWLKQVSTMYTVRSLLSDICIFGTNLIWASSGKGFRITSYGDSCIS